MGCFFKKVKPVDAQIIKGFSDLRWDDQEKILAKVNGSSKNKSSKTKIRIKFSSVKRKIFFSSQYM